MRKVIHIARNELYNLFYSPIAWTLMILFIIMTAGTYFDRMEWLIKISAGGGGRQLAFLEYLTSRIASDLNGGFLHNVRSTLYFFFPLVTMGLISREKNAETIKLLYSSPVRIRDIVLGKYLGIIVFVFFLMMLLSLILLSMTFSIINPDYLLLLTSIIGIFLIVSTYAAIGLFVSSLTAYQIVAALITFAILILFHQIKYYWQDIDIIRYISYYLDISGKSADIILGWINLRDVTYFLLIISVFLSFTIIKLKSGTESKSLWKKSLRYITVIIIALIVGYITDRPSVNIYFDSTRNDIYTIAKPTQETLAKLNEGELEITAYVNLFSDYFFRFSPEQLMYVEKSLFEPYQRFKPDMNIDFRFYYNTDSSNYRITTNRGKTIKQIASDYTKEIKIKFDKFLSPEEVKRFVDVDAEENRCFFVLKYKGKQTILRTFDDPGFFPSENEVAAALNRLVSKPPLISFVSGEIERSPLLKREKDYRSLTSSLEYRQSLKNQGYDFDTVDLSSASPSPDLAALVIADPRTPIHHDKLDKINKYIDAGGNLMVLSEPDRTEIVQPVLNKLGVSLRPGMLIQPSVQFSSDMLLTTLTDTAKNMSPTLERTLRNETKYWNDSISRLGMKGASVIDFDSAKHFQVFPLMLTDSVRSWNRVLPISEDSLQLKVARAVGDQLGSFATGLQLRRNINGREQRIIILSDADCLHTHLFRSMVQPRAYNEEFRFWTFGYFSYGQFPANTLLEESIDNKLLVSLDQLDTQKVIFYYIVPALLAITCSVLLIRRKRK